MPAAMKHIRMALIVEKNTHFLPLRRGKENILSSHLGRVKPPHLHTAKLNL